MGKIRTNHGQIMDKFLPAPATAEWPKLFFWLYFGMSLEQADLVGQGWMDVRPVKSPGNDRHQQSDGGQCHCKPEGWIHHGLKKTHLGQVDKNVQ